MMHGRSTAELLDASRVRITYACGHTSVKDYSKGPVPKRIPPAGLKIQVAWWNKNGCIAACPKGCTLLSGRIGAPNRKNDKENPK